MCFILFIEHIYLHRLEKCILMMSWDADTVFEAVVHLEDSIFVTDTILFSVYFVVAKQLWCDAGDPGFFELVLGDAGQCPSMLITFHILS